jgi:hypothetical protein
MKKMLFAVAGMLFIFFCISLFPEEFGQRQFDNGNLSFYMNVQAINPFQT